MRARARLTLLLALVALSVGCDQATKRFAVEQLQAAPPSTYVFGVVRVQYAENPGAFLSLGAGLGDGVRLWVFTVGVGVLLVGALLAVLLNARLTPATIAGFALFIGGGLSNWIDRALHGSLVVDFVSLGVGPLRTGIFNVADVFIMAGLALVALAAWRQPADSGPR